VDNATGVVTVEYESKSSSSSQTTASSNAGDNTGDTAEKDDGGFFDFFSDGSDSGWFDFLPDFDILPDFELPALSDIWPFTLHGVIGGPI